MLATGLGAIPVLLLGERAAGMQPLLWGVAAGMMGVASVVGLTLPALEDGSPGGRRRGSRASWRSPSTTSRRARPPRSRCTPPASRARQFWAAVATSVPPPVGAVVAYLLVEQGESLPPGVARLRRGRDARARAVEMAPKALERGRRG